MLQVILTPTCRVSGYPRQVIKVATVLRQLRFICTALPTVITLITIIPLGTCNTSSWYIFLLSLMTAVCLSLLHWTASFTGLLPFLLCFPLLLSQLFYSASFSTLVPFLTLLPFTHSSSCSTLDLQSQSYVTTDGQSASLSWKKAPIWGLRQDLCYCQTVAGLFMWGALSDERTGLSFTNAADPRQRSHSRVRVPWHS
jgi:hypothetical protein